MAKPAAAAILSQLAGALGRRDEIPNVALAEALAQNPNPDAIAALVAALTTGTVSVQGDAIKVLYELGERKPELITRHTETFVALLATRNNRLQWGIMTALDSLGVVESKRLSTHLKVIVTAAERASVIGKDKAVSLLCKLHAAGSSQATWGALVRLLDDAANNQFPSYVEQVERVAQGAHRAELAAMISARLPLVPQPAKTKRLTATLKRL
jgi:HEAT repeat protein